MSIFRDTLAPLIHDALKTLLCEKHLYQSTKVDIEPLNVLAKQLEDEPKSAEHNPYLWRGGGGLAAAAALLLERDSVQRIPWVFDTGAAIHRARNNFDRVSFHLPSINTYCSTCESAPPFNPVCDMSCCLVDARDDLQWYHLAYECQQCKGSPIMFLVRRDGSKLTLAGRDPLEAVPAPKVLPKRHAKFFSDAQIAHNAGQTLAGLFLLRTFIEQFWRSIPEVRAVIKLKQRATGDEQGAEYQATLPAVFKSQFPSLLDIYGRLSAAMHEARPDAPLFDRSCAEIEKHFKARELFDMFVPPEASSNPAPPS